MQANKSEQRRLPARTPIEQDAVEKSAKKKSSNMKKLNILIDRKVLSEIAISDNATFYYVTPLSPMPYGPS